MGVSLEAADLLGWVAVLFTLTAFSMRTMLPLRIAAIGANVCFIGFGYLEGTLPILTLHVILLPCNVMRLLQIVLAKREVDRKNESRLRDAIASTPPHSRNAPAYRNGMVAVTTSYQAPAKCAQVISAARPEEHASPEIADLRAQIEALREQLRLSTFDQTVTRRSTNDERRVLSIGDGP